MPSLEFASGLLGGYFNTMAEERTRREQNALRAAQFLLQTGAVRDPNDLLPFLQPLLDQSGPLGSLRKKPGAGGGAKGGGGEGDPWTILSTLIAPTLQRGPGQAPGPQAGAGPSTFPPPAPAPSAPPAPRRQPFLMTEPELFQRQLGQAAATRRTEGAIDVETDIAKKGAEQAQRERFWKSIQERFPGPEHEETRRFLATGTFAPAYRPVTIPRASVDGEDLPPGTLDALGNPVEKGTRYGVRETSPGEFEYFPLAPTGAGQQEFSASLRDQISERIGKPFGQVTTEEKIKALKAIREDKRTDEALKRESLAGMIAMRALLLKEKKEESTLDETPVTGMPPDPATANVPQPRYGGLTPAAVYEGGLVYGLTGQYPGGGGFAARGPRLAQQTSVRNAAAARASLVGTTQAQLQYEYRALAQATKNQMVRIVGVENGRRVADANLDLVLELSKTVDRGSMPAITSKLQALARAWAPAVGLSAFETAIYTASREYARVMTAPTSGASLPVAAAAAVERLIRPSDPPERLEAEIAVMRRDMGNQAREHQAMLREITQNAPNVAAYLGVRVAPGPTPQAPGAGGRGRGPGRTVYDINGNPIRQ